MNKGAEQRRHVDHGRRHVDLPEALVHALVVVGAAQLGVLGSAEAADLLADGFARLEVILLMHQAKHRRSHVLPYDELQGSAKSQTAELEHDQRVPAGQGGGAEFRVRCMLQLDEGQQGHDAQGGSHGEVLGEEDLLYPAEGMSRQVEVEGQARHEGHPHLGTEVRGEGTKVGQRYEYIGAGLCLGTGGGRGSCTCCCCCIACDRRLAY